VAFVGGRRPWARAIMLRRQEDVSIGCGCKEVGIEQGAEAAVGRSDEREK